MYETPAEMFVATDSVFDLQWRALYATIAIAKILDQMARLQFNSTVTVTVDGVAVDGK